MSFTHHEDNRREKRTSSSVQMAMPTRGFLFPRYSLELLQCILFAYEKGQNVANQPYSTASSIRKFNSFKATQLPQPSIICNESDVVGGFSENVLSTQSFEQWLRFARGPNVDKYVIDLNLYECQPAKSIGERNVVTSRKVIG